MNIVIFGPPGAGKGTQSNFIVEKFKLHQLSTGELLRKEIKDSTQLKEEHTIKEIISKNEFLVTLNENGQSFTSKQLATKLLNSHNQNITFVIGGASGLTSSLNNLASWQLSLSPLTFPHEIARLLLIEQLYRAKTITQGGPYHKE